MKLDPCLTPLTKINWKWIKDLNIRPETVKLPEENVGKKLFDIGSSDDFLNTTPMAPVTKGKIDNVHIMKMKKILCLKRHY